jgi:hypothetical protein
VPSGKKLVDVTLLKKLHGIKLLEEKIQCLEIPKYPLGGTNQNRTLSENGNKKTPKPNIRSTRVAHSGVTDLCNRREGQR